MKETTESPFKLTTRDINQGAIAKAAGYAVETYKQPAGRRALFSFNDTQEIRDLIDKFERGEILPFPAKVLLNARTELYFAAVKAVRGESL